MPECLAYQHALHEQVSTLGLKDVIRFLGQRDSREVRIFLKEAHVFVAPSVELPNGDKDGILIRMLRCHLAGSRTANSVIGKLLRHDTATDPVVPFHL